MAASELGLQGIYNNKDFHPVLDGAALEALVDSIGTRAVGAAATHASVEGPAREEFAEVAGGFMVLAQEAEELGYPQRQIA